jgi:hypothetical protein
MDMGINGLESVVNEMDVQDRYRVAFRYVFKDIIFESKYRTDGLAYSEKNKLRMLLEHKHRRNFISMIERAMVVAQVIRYIKTIHDENPKIMPKVAVVGDENECFVLPVKDIINYISIKEYDWSLSPSSMHQDKVLISDLIDDDVIKGLYIYNPQNEFKEIVNKIKEINKGVNVPRTLTEKNIDKVYNFFTDKITLKRFGKKISTNDSVNLFAHIMLHPDSVMLNNKTKQLFTGMFKEPLSVSNVESYNSFVTEFSRTYTPKQKHIFTAILDRLIEDTTRRKQGEFFTPAIWVDKAHEYIESVYGDDWKEKYIVWDPAWGTGNLTRDYKFKELYVSTLNQSDIDTANQMGYNPEATKFQFDFLNDPYEYLPKGLKNAIESGKQIIVLMNPPYAAGTGMDVNNVIRKGMSDTKVGLEMEEENLANSKQQLYTQFMFKCKKMGINGIAIFSKPLFMSGSSYKEFRTSFTSDFEYENGFLMDSKEFSDVESWGLSFTIWVKKIDAKQTSIFTLDVLEMKESNIECVGQKKVYNVKDCENLSKWMRTTKFKLLKYSLPTTNGVRVPAKNKIFKQPNEFIGYIHDHSNNVQNNTSGVGLYTTIFSGSHGCFFNHENFMKVCGVFSARRAVESTWVNEKDEYIKPNEQHIGYGQYLNDSIVYSMFNNSSYQSSLRNVNYIDKTYNVKNQFFWMSKEEISNTANNGNYPELYNDARTDSDRYVYNLLFGEQRIYDQLSDEAKDVLDTASNLVRLSFGMRRNFADDTNHLNSWDAGYAQLKLLWKEYYPEQFKEFRAKYKVLEEKMRPMVYELGFLLK